MSGKHNRTATDGQGRTLQVNAGRLSLHDSQLTLTVEVARIVLPRRKVVGRVVDTDGEPIPGVRVGAATSSAGGGSAATFINATTGEGGEFAFEIRLFPHRNDVAGKNRRINLILTKEGFASKDSQRRSLVKSDKPLDFGTITLKPGHSIKVHVTNQAGEPLVGASVAPSGSYAAIRQIMRTNKSGIAILEGLRIGGQNISARWGELSESTHVFIGEGENDPIELQLNPRPTIVNQERPSPTDRVPVEVGAAAPELNAAGWSDGRERNLSDYRGKIVVLDFWGIWCTGCLVQIPATKQLEAEFADEDVVFLAIHSAGEEMSQVKDALEYYDWHVPSAIDRGESTATGKTTLAYGVQGWPTTVIIGRGGKITFNTDAVNSDEEMMAIMKSIATVNNLSWPPPSSSKEKMKEWAAKMHKAWLSHEIKKALAK